MNFKANKTITRIDIAFQANQGKEFAFKPSSIRQDTTLNTHLHTELTDDMESPLNNGGLYHRPYKILRAENIKCFNLNPPQKLN